tara:strand:- start:122 stop:385 length:264 start_codon:yes stop_codon:yes gene_type:complete
MQDLISRIEKLDPKHHVVIGAILKKDGNLKFNENINGVMINASTISEQSTQEITKFLSYLEEQENILYKIETQKEEMKQEYFEEQLS